MKRPYKTKTKILFTIIVVVIVYGVIQTWGYVSLLLAKQRILENIAKSDYINAYKEAENAIKLNKRDPVLELLAGKIALNAFTKKDTSLVRGRFVKAPVEAYNHFCKAVNKTDEENQTKIIEDIKNIYAEQTPQFYDLTLNESAKNSDIDISLTGSGKGTSVNCITSAKCLPEKV